jgi:hypothetical protein
MVFAVGTHLRLEAILVELLQLGWVRAEVDHKQRLPIHSLSWSGLGVAR